MNYNRAIKMLAAARGVSLKQLARMLGMNSASLTRLGRCGNSPTSRTLERVAHELEAPLYLLVLLASDPEDLGTAPAEAIGLGMRLLAALLGRPAAPPHAAQVPLDRPMTPADWNAIADVYGLPRPYQAEPAPDGPFERAPDGRIVLKTDATSSFRR